MGSFGGGGDGGHLSPSSPPTFPAVLYTCALGGRCWQPGTASTPPSLSLVAGIVNLRQRKTPKSCQSASCDAVIDEEAVVVMVTVAGAMVLAVVVIPGGSWCL